MIGGVQDKREQKRERWASIMLAAFIALMIIQAMTSI